MARAIPQEPLAFFWRDREVLMNRQGTMVLEVVLPISFDCHKAVYMQVHFSFHHDGKDFDLTGGIIPIRKSGRGKNIPSGSWLTFVPGDSRAYKQMRYDVSKKRNQWAQWVEEQEVDFYVNSEDRIFLLDRERRFQVFPRPVTANDINRNAKRMRGEATDVESSEESDESDETFNEVVVDDHSSVVSLEEPDETRNEVVVDDYLSVDSSEQEIETIREATDVNSIDETFDDIIFDDYPVIRPSVKVTREATDVNSIDETFDDIIFDNYPVIRPSVKRTHETFDDSSSGISDILQGSLYSYHSEMEILPSPAKRKKSNERADEPVDEPADEPEIEITDVVISSPAKRKKPNEPADELADEMAEEPVDDDVPDVHPTVTCMEKLEALMTESCVPIEEVFEKMKTFVGKTACSLLYVGQEDSEEDMLVKIMPFVDGDRGEAVKNVYEEALCHRTAHKVATSKPGSSVFPTLKREHLAYGKFPRGFKDGFMGQLTMYEAKHPDCFVGDHPKDYPEGQMYLITWFDKVAKDKLLEDRAPNNTEHIKSMISQLGDGLADLESLADGEIRCLIPNNIVIQSV
ncbi:uncharacterized protein [Clytia hemisphaerica]|uniref:uncharacterized protein n=1 Tax=Clytia hemisphaerica TaxID=252671 RepID=UPI0034D775FE